MRNYNTLNEILLDETSNFVGKLSKNLGKVDTHFISDITTGILKENSVILSDIVRATGMQNIKKGVERLERHLDDFESISKNISNNYIDMVKPYINNRKLYFVDRGDIVKDKETKFENLGYVLDGSDEHKLKYGYQLNEIATLDNNNQPISLVSELRSANDNDYNSDTTLWEHHIKFVNETYGKGTFVMDRGYDGAILMEKIIKMNSDFIIRANSLKRKVIEKGKQTTISDIGKSCKGQYVLNSEDFGTLKVTGIQIRINSVEAKELKQKTLTLVIVKGFGINEKKLNEAYMALITSRNVTGKAAVLQVVRDYLLRWKIEENFKYKKQQFSIEKIKVRRYKRIKALNTLLSYVMFLSNVINLKSVGKTIRKQVNQIRKEIKFWLYRISDGIKKVMNFVSMEIMKILYPARQKRRRDLWTCMGVRYNPN